MPLGASKTRPMRNQCRRVHGCSFAAARSFIFNGPFDGFCRVREKGRTAGERGSAETMGGRDVNGGLKCSLAAAGRSLLGGLGRSPRGCCISHILASVKSLSTLLFFSLPLFVCIHICIPLSLELCVSLYAAWSSGVSLYWTFSRGNI